MPQPLPLVQDGDLIAVASLGVGERLRKECAKRSPTARIAKPEAPVLIEFTIKPARKLVVVPPVTAGVGFCSAAIHDVSFETLFTAMELTALKPW